FSADGKTLLLATDSTLRLFDTTGKERALPGHRSAVTPLFADDGKTLSTSCRERRCRWNVSSMKEPALLAHEPREPHPVKWLARLADQLFLDRLKRQGLLRETTTGRVLRELEDYGHDRIPVSGWLSPDSTRMLLKHMVGDGKKLDRFLLYDAKTGKKSGEINPVHPTVYPVFSPNNQLVACADPSGGVHLHDAVTGKIVRTLRSSRPLSETNGRDGDLVFSPDGERLIVTTYLYGPKSKRTTLPARVFRVSSGWEIGRFSTNPEKTASTDWLSCAAWSPNGQLLAVAGEESGTVRLLEIASGKVRAEFVGHRHGVHGLAFAPDGQTLASGGEDNVAFLWDVTGARTLVIEKKTLAEWWNDLAGDDGKRAGVAIASLIRTPEQSVAMLQQRLHPADTLTEKRLVRLLTDLDSNVFETRETASRELGWLGERAEAALRRALTKRPSLEVRRRIEDLLDKLPGSPSPETLRALRAIEILEYVGTPAARRCLQALTKGAPDALPTRDAIAALDRLTKRR
ncbi:MAG TPA: hypothetical protein VN688_18895, partial [Gemmataceae bacterium]|nr:hypothetical protein [Gemmataceae bacterium]